MNGLLFDWSLYADYAEKKVLKKNTVLYRQGDKTNGFYYLKEGKVMISILRDDGYERIIDFVYPGTLIGEQTVNRTPSFTTATLMVDSTLYYFSIDQFERLIQKYPEASKQLIYSLIKKIRLLVNNNVILNAPVDIQIAHFLLNLYEKKGSCTIHLTRNSIAKYIGKSRVTVWSVLKEWTKEGTIEMSNREIVIKRLEKLKELTEKVLS